MNCKILALLTIALGLSFFVFAVPDLNNHRVNDFANLMTQEEKGLLTEKIMSIESNTTIQITIVIVTERMTRLKLAG